MSWFKTFLACLCLTAGLAGCGFEPLYAAKGVAATYPAIEISNIPDRDGQFLRNKLIDRLYTAGRPVDAPYELRFSPLVKDIVDFGIRKNAAATRAQIQISTQMQLIEKSSGKILLQRDLRANGAHDLLDNQLATLVSQQTTVETILQALGDDAVTALNLYFRRQALP